MSKLNQIAWSAVSIGAGINKQDGGGGSDVNEAAQGGAFNAFYFSQVEEAGDEYRSGVAGGDKG